MWENIMEWDQHVGATETSQAAEMHVFLLPDEECTNSPFLDLLSGFELFWWQTKSVILLVWPIHLIRREKTRAFVSLVLAPLGQFAEP